MIHSTSGGRWVSDTAGYPGLDLVDFKPPKAARGRAVKRARRATWRYFGLPVPEAGLDPGDDAETDRIFASDRPCG